MNPVERPNLASFLAAAHLPLAAAHLPLAAGPAKVYRRVQRHGGRIQAETAPGQGACSLTVLPPPSSQESP